MTAANIQQLYAILKAEKETTDKLLQLLKVERDSLTTTDVDKMAAIAQQKQPLIVNLEQLGRQRENILQTSGFPTGKMGLEAFIENQPAKQASLLNKVVSALRKSAKACRENNQINGGIVNVNRQYLQKAMAIIRGKDTSTNAYGPGGEYASQVVQQPLIGRV